MTAINRFIDQSLIEYLPIHVIVVVKVTRISV